MSFSIRIVDRNNIKKIPPDNGAFFVPKNFWWVSPEKLKRYLFLII